MKTFKVPVSRDDYGYIIITAKTKEEAVELIEAGEWENEMFEPKGGSVSVSGGEVEEIG